MRASSARRCGCARTRAGWNCREESALYLQRRFPRDLPTLYELLDTIDEAALQAQRRLTVPFIRAGARRAARACRVTASSATRRPSACASLRSSSVSSGCTPATCEAP